MIQSDKRIEAIKAAGEEVAFLVEALASARQATVVQRQRVERLVADVRDIDRDLQAKGRELQAKLAEMAQAEAEMANLHRVLVATSANIDQLLSIATEAPSDD